VRWPARPALVGHGSRGEDRRQARSISLTVNGKGYEFEVEPKRLSLNSCGRDCHLMRTKEGCGVASADRAPVLMDKQAVASCLVLAVDADGSRS